MWKKRAQSRLVNAVNKLATKLKRLQIESRYKVEAISLEILQDVHTKTYGCCSNRIQIDFVFVTNRSHDSVSLLFLACLENETKSDSI